MTSLRVRSPFKQAILFIIFTAISLGCRSATPDRLGKGHFASASIPFKTYSSAAIASLGQNAGKFYFPVLQIYDAEGRLIYSDHNSSANAEILEKGSDDLWNGKPQDGKLPLDEILSGVPALASQLKNSDKANRRTVLTVFLEDCHACSIQEEALRGSQQRLLDDGINVLVLRVTKTT